jgi:hypothetical protein
MESIHRQCLAHEDARRRSDDSLKVSILRDERSFE